ncbi:MAG: hypothetical protein A3H27_14830 [Acidobacteria bacterium RIFCSPLOWO2_02_FULL_59_13]|nr:MAG: hypothetical protein A3H27_14830 [Acidobacteria bacterium RIFCSPLOWO2_02_FULL_59_13]
MPKRAKVAKAIPSARKGPSFARWFFGELFRLIRRFGNGVTICVTVAYVANVIGNAVQAFAGQRSLADLRLGLFANISVVYTLSITLSGISVVLYLRERRLHRRTRERLTARNTELELRIDPTRTSSQLTSEGLTRKEDE